MNTVGNLKTIPAAPAPVEMRFDPETGDLYYWRQISDSEAETFGLADVATLNDNEIEKEARLTLVAIDAAFEAGDARREGAFLNRSNALQVEEHDRWLIEFGEAREWAARNEDEFLERHERRYLDDNDGLSQDVSRPREQ
jgi:hypothetical protein